MVITVGVQTYMATSWQAQCIYYYTRHPRRRILSHESLQRPRSPCFQLFSDSSHDPGQAT